MSLSTRQRNTSQNNRKEQQDMLKKNIEDLAQWIYEISDWLFDRDTPENWWSEERLNEWNEDNGECFYLSEILCRELMTLTK